MDDLQRLEDWVSPLLARLSAAEQRGLARAVAKDLRAGNAVTMRAQQAPVGFAEEHLDGEHLGARVVAGV